MAVDLFGPTVASGGVTSRPAETRTHGATDTFWKDCADPDTDDGTEWEAAAANQIVELLRKLARGNGQTTVGAVDIVTEDNADDFVLLKSVQHLIQRNQPRWCLDTGSQNTIVGAPSPALKEYKAGIEIDVKIAVDNTGPATANFSGLGAVAIKNYVGADLVSKDLRTGMIAKMQFDGTYWQLTNGQQSTIKVLSANTTFYVNGTTGHDVNFNGTAAVVSGVNGPFKTISRAMQEAFKFGPSATYGITIIVADGTYLESVATSTIPGPSVTIEGNMGTPANCHVNSTGIGNSITVNGPNVLTVKGVKATVATANMAAFCANGAGATLYTFSTENGAVTSWVFLGNGGGAVYPAAHRFAASCGQAFAAYRNGTVNLVGSVSYTITTPITVTTFALAVSGGQIEVPGTGTPSFTNPGNVTGQKYFAQLNGVINTQGQGASYFPGTVAGATATGGQYA
jgi:hypothetical protein